jgi:hypothetical protein
MVPGSTPEGMHLRVVVKKSPRLSPHQSTSLRTGPDRGCSRRAMVSLCKGGTRFGAFSQPV